MKKLIQVGCLMISLGSLAACESSIEELPIQESIISMRSYVLSELENNDYVEKTSEGYRVELETADTEGMILAMDDVKFTAVDSAAEARLIESQIQIEDEVVSQYEVMIPVESK